MRSRKLTALLMTTALCATALFGCGSDDGQTTTTAAQGGSNEEAKEVTMKVWSPAEDQAEGCEWLQTQCNKFAEEHPNWKITWVFETCGEDKAGETVAQDPAAAADVYMFASDQIKKLVECNGIAELAGEAATYVKNTNSEAIVNNVTYDGAIYGIPYTANCWYMYYDKRVFNEDDVKSLEIMLEKGRVAFDVGNSWMIEAFYLACGAQFGPDSAPSIVMNGEGGIEATKYIANLIENENFISAGGVSGLGDTIDATFSGSWDLANAKELLGENLGMAVPPTINVENGDGQMKGFASAKAVGVNPNTADMEVAIELAKFLCSEEAQKARYELRGVIPCNTALLEDEAIANDEAFIAQNGTYDNYSIVQPAYLNDFDYWTQAGNMGSQLNNGDVTAANAAEAVDAMNKAMNDAAIAAGVLN